MSRRVKTAIVALLLVLLILFGAAWYNQNSQGFKPKAESATTQAEPVPSPTTATASSRPALAYGPGPRQYTYQAQPPANSCHYRIIDAAKGEVLPDPTCTPGSLNPKVTQATLSTTICRAGYTTSIRPSQKITAAEKYDNAVSYGWGAEDVTYNAAGTVFNWSGTEYDHLVSLELGGDPNDPSNLWPELNVQGGTTVNNPKDAVEGVLNHAICNGTVTLAAAQVAIATNWTTAEQVLGLS